MVEVEEQGVVARDSPEHTLPETNIAHENHHLP